MDNFFTTVKQNLTEIPRHLQNLFTGKREKLKSPLADVAPTPTPDPWVDIGYVKAGGGYYKKPTKPKEGYTYINKDKIPPDVLAELDPNYKAPSVLGATPFEFNFTPHINEKTKRTIYAPPDEDKALFQEFFPKEATSAATAAFNESMYNPKAENQNTQGPHAGEWDTGYFQISDGSLQHMLKYYPNTMKKIGVQNREDLKDKRKNFAVAKLVREKLEDRTGSAAWSSWKGWQDQGFVDVGNPNVKY